MSALGRSIAVIGGGPLPLGLPPHDVIPNPQLAPPAPRSPDGQREVVVAGLVGTDGPRAVEVEHGRNVYSVHQFVKIDHSTHARTLVELGPQTWYCGPNSTTSDPRADATSTGACQANHWEVADMQDTTCRGGRHGER